jgi:hypothetical protein
MPKAKNWKLRLACLEQWKAQNTKPKDSQTNQNGLNTPVSSVSDKVFSKHNRRRRS